MSSVYWRRKEAVAQHPGRAIRSRLITAALESCSAGSDTIAAMLRLMVVTAHPDDEAGAFGGTMRLYADRGVETCVLCMTPGQAASHRGNARTDQELAE